MVENVALSEPVDLLAPISRLRTRGNHRNKQRALAYRGDVIDSPRCFYCQKIKRIVHDERLAFIATTPEAYRVRTTEAYYTFVAFIYDSVYETEPPPWNYC
uniref:Uncharacterized protein n=1 Tax=Haemonchus contortus TaxID=6289 RepID=A0A7I4YV00_HAECO